MLDTTLAPKRKQLKDLVCLSHHLWEIWPPIWRQLSLALTLDIALTLRTVDIALAFVCTLFFTLGKCISLDTYSYCICHEWKYFLLLADRIPDFFKILIWNKWQVAYLINKYARLIEYTILTGLTWHHVFGVRCKWGFKRQPCIVDMALKNTHIHSGLSTVVARWVDRRANNLGVNGSMWLMGVEGLNGCGRLIWVWRG